MIFVFGLVIYAIGFVRARQTPLMMLAPTWAMACMSLGIVLMFISICMLAWRYLP